MIRMFEKIIYDNNSKRCAGSDTSLFYLGYQLFKNSLIENTPIQYVGYNSV